MEGADEMMKKDKVGVVEQFVFGSGQVGLNALYTLFSSYVLYFYTDVIGMNAALIGTVILISKVFDGVSDLIAGQLIDTHKSKRGHCIPVLAKWTLPMVASVTLVFLVPDLSIALRTAFIFVTYNLFKTVLYTYVNLAHNSLASYATDDPTTRSKMLCYSMLFAALTQTIMASAILPMVNFYGGQDSQSAWVKSILTFGAVGTVFLFLNVLAVKERVDNETPSENIIQSVKVAFQNKYWLMSAVLQICCTIVLLFNLSISVYYLENVAGNLGLMGAYVAASNIPGIIGMLIIPSFLDKISKKKLVLLGGVFMLIGQVVFILGPTDNTTILIGTALLRGIGFMFPMGLVNAMTGDTIEYGEWKTGTKVQAVLFSAKCVAEKLGQGLMTSLFGFFLTAVGYDGNLAAQPESAVLGIEKFFKFAPLVAIAVILLICMGWKLDDEMPQIQKELEARREKAIAK